MEKWDLYTLDREKTNQVITRGDSIPNDLYHLVVHVCIFNAKNQMLIQQRQSFKEGWPNMWDLTVGGSAMIGENSRQAATREAAEELGLKIDLENIPPVITKYFSEGFDDIYILEKEIDISKLRLQYEEVQAVKWVCFEEILDMVGSKKFIPYDESFIQFLFHLHQVNSLYQK
ncbi:MAG: NUDIX domain-containing protein [Solobacterium sp.]|jgi:hydrolase, NUDIX family|nr:NUDIX domain-containing protein [Solobacterium sp.]